MRKRFLAVVLGIIALVCSGCFGGHVELSIDESGAVHSKNTMVGVEFMREELEKQKQELLKDHPNAIVTPAHDGNMSGFSIQMDYEDMDSFAADGMKFYATRPGFGKGIQKKSRWFFDAYALDLYEEGNADLSKDKEAAAMAQALLSQIRFDFTLNLPYEADSHNAETVSNNGRTLSWNIASTITRGESRKIQATFKLWNKLHIALTVGIAVLLLVVAVIFAIQAASAEGGEKQTKMGFAVGLGVVLLVLALGSAYLLLAPVKFTDGDIISGTWQPEEKPKTTQSASQTIAPALKPTQQSTQQNRQNNAPAAPSADAQGKPTQVLQAFHRNITNKNYREAYNCLSGNYQSAVSYEGWAPGFRTTVSSTVSDVKIESQTDSQAVLTYILKAVDNPGGTQYFRGTAVLVRTPNGWKIDEITNKTM